MAGVRGRRRSRCLVGRRGVRSALVRGIAGACRRPTRPARRASSPASPSPSPSPVGRVRLRSAGVRVGSAPSAGGVAFGRRPSGTVVLTGAGDIAICGYDGDRQTSDAASPGSAGIVFTAGDNAYDRDGRPSSATAMTRPGAGSRTGRVLPVAGNHDWDTPGAAGYLGYFGDGGGAAGRHLVLDGHRGLARHRPRLELRELVGGCGPARRRAGGWPPTSRRARPAARSRSGTSPRFSSRRARQRPDGRALLGRAPRGTARSSSSTATTTTTSGSRRRTRAASRSGPAGSARSSSGPAARSCGGFGQDGAEQRVVRPRARFGRPPADAPPGTRRESGSATGAVPTDRARSPLRVDGGTVPLTAGTLRRMVDHARAVIIGGGVGGTSIAYHLAERGWTDIVLVDRAELTSGLDVPLGRARRPAPELGDPDDDDDVRRRAVPAAGRRDRRRPVVARGRLAPPGLDAGRGSRSSSARRAGRKTFGLPLELIIGDGGPGPLPADVDRRRARRGLAADRRLARPVRAGHGAGRRRPARGVKIRTHTRVVGIGVERGRVTGVTVEHARRAGRRSRADVVVNAGGMFAPEIGRLAGVTVPIIPMAHQYLLHRGDRGRPPGLPQLRDPDNLVYFREEVGGLCMGGYERDPAPWSLDGVPPDFNGKLLAPDWPRFEAIMDGAVRRVPAIADAGVDADDQRARGVHARQRVHPRRDRTSAGSSSPPGSRPTGSRARAGSAARWRAGSSTASRSSTSGRWTSGGSGRHYRSPRYTLARSIENYATYYDIHYPNEERQAGRPLRDVADVRRLAALGAVFGEKSGWERPNWFEPNAAAPAGDGPSSRRSARAAGPASTGARRSAPRRWRRGRRPACSTRRRSPSSRSSGPGAVGVPAVDVRQRRRRAGRPDRLHASCSTAAAGSSAT